MGTVLLLHVSLSEVIGQNIKAFKQDKYETHSKETSTTATETTVPKNPVMGTHYCLISSFVDRSSQNFELKFFQIF